MQKLTLSRYDYGAFGSFIAYAGCSIIIPLVLCQAARELGFPLQEGGFAAGGALQMGRAIPMVLAMLSCGFAAGRWGMRKTLGWSVVLMGIGICVASLSPTYTLLFLALMIVGLGEGVIEGLATPFVEGLHKEESGRYLNFSHSFWGLGVFATALLGGWLLSRSISWRYLVGSVAVLALVPALLLLLPEGRIPYPERQGKFSLSIVYRQTLEILRNRHFWLFFAAMFVAGGGEFGLTFWSASYIQIEFTATPLMGGIGTACFAVGLFLGRSASGILVSQKYLPHLIVFTGILGIAVSLFFPLLNSPWIIAQQAALPWLAVFSKKWLLFGLLFFAGITSAPFWPSVQSYTSKRLPQLDSTMLFVLLSCAGIPGCASASWLMGVVGNHIGLRRSFLIIPACYLILTILIGADWYISKKSAAKTDKTGY